MSELVLLLIAIFASAAGVIITGMLLDRRAEGRWEVLFNEFVDLSAEVIQWNLTVELSVFLNNHKEVDSPEKTKDLLRFAHDIKEADLETAYRKYLLTKIDFGVGAET